MTEPEPGRPEPAPGGTEHPQPPGAVRDYDDPPWWGARDWLARAWSRGGAGARAILLVAGAFAAGLLGAFLFGAWHVVVGGMVHGNWSAAAFGFALCGVAGALLWLEASLARRLLTPPRRGVTDPGVKI